jgi:DNA-binding transcriptional ArsR family regulator
MLFLDANVNNRSLNSGKRIFSEWIIRWEGCHGFGRVKDGPFRTNTNSTSVDFKYSWSIRPCMSENGRTLQVIEKAFNIINYLQEADGARVSEIASDLEMPPSTVHVHLNTLKNSGVVVQEGDIYYLSLRFLRHGNYVQPLISMTRNSGFC